MERKGCCLCWCGELLLFRIKDGDIDALMRERLTLWCFGMWRCLSWLLPIMAIFTKPDATPPKHSTLSQTTQLARHHHTRYMHNRSYHLLTYLPTPSITQPVNHSKAKPKHTQVATFSQHYTTHHPPQPYLAESLDRTPKKPFSLPRLQSKTAGSFVWSNRPEMSMFLQGEGKKREVRTLEPTNEEVVD